MKKCIGIALLILIVWSANCASTLAATWYVDNRASGSNNGTSWSNAWESFANINWGGVAPGDNVYISGGSSSKIYNETLDIDASGTSNNNIIIQTGQDAGHNGTVIIDGQDSRNNCILLSDYVTVSGQVGNNRRMLIRGSLASGIHSGSADGNVIKFVEITDCGSEGAPGSFAHGIRLGAANNDCEVAYNYIHHNYADGYNAGGSAGGRFGVTKIHDNIIVDNSDDGIACRSGHDIYNNVIGNLFHHPGGGDGHPDGIQAQGEYTRIWNNEVYNCHTHGIFADPYRVGTARHIYIYNNLVYKTNEAPADMNMQGIKVKAESGTDLIEDVLVANNTVVDMGYLGIQIKASNTNGVIVKNNLIYNNRLSGTHGYVLGATNNEPDIDYNLVNEGPNGGTKMLWNDVNITYNEFVGSGFGQQHGQTGRPIFINYQQLSPNNNFHLDSSDTAAIGNGINLSSYFTTDKDGNNRASWDIGCYAADSDNPSPPDAPTPPANVEIVN